MRVPPFFDCKYRYITFYSVDDYRVGVKGHTFGFINTESSFERATVLVERWKKNGKEEEKLRK